MGSLVVSPPAVVCCSWATPRSPGLGPAWHRLSSGGPAKPSTGPGPETLVLSWKLWAGHGMEAEGGEGNGGRTQEEGQGAGHVQP